ncbi:DUF664 domain-containing protein [uncultured Brachybacterium sp.]|uniref:mycothiol transferase n=1 Tax=uncultured Brachybacterium sp. TaxID=189680 RepID=UPI0026110563|nr:DUF664 domain-containing protein [uncultured Brachybacterium sp.]
MPFLTAETTDERDSLATFAQQQIDQVATALHGLEREQLALVPSASGMSLGALARHVLLISTGAAQAMVAAPDAPPAPTGTPQQLMAEGGLAPDALREGDTPDSLIEQLQQVGAQLAAAIRGVDLETRGPVPDQPWFEGRATWSLRWYALHMIEENARHAGHADLLRESIDGKGAYELNALAAGQSWPPANW